MKHISKSAEVTQKIAKEFALTLKGGDILLLHGNLGAGKTTFMQGIAEGLGITQSIISPTFIIMREYEVRMKDEGSRINMLYHLDLYRINSDSDLVTLGLEEIFQDKNAIVAIEWPERLGSYLPKKRIEINMKYISENERVIEIENI